MTLAPLATYDELHPDRTAFASCSDWNEVRHVYSAPFLTKALSGAMVSCLGRMPAVCHERAATETAFDFLELAGVEPPTNLTTYACDEDAIRLSTSLAAEGKRLATAHPQLPAIRALNASLVPPETYNFLNDKRNLAALCPAPCIPVRRIYGSDEIHDIDLDTIAFPVYVKGAFEGGTGNGLDVRYCRDAESFCDSYDWYRAARDFQALIVEVAIAFTTSWCLSFSVCPSSEHLALFSDRLRGALASSRG
jgi:hypothetical protein